MHYILDEKTGKVVRYCPVNEEALKVVLGAWRDRELCIDVRVMQESVERYNQILVERYNQILGALRQVSEDAGFDDAQSL